MGLSCVAFGREVPWQGNCIGFLNHAGLFRLLVLTHTEAQAARGSQTDLLDMGSSAIGYSLQLFHCGGCCFDIEGTTDKFYWRQPTQEPCPPERKPPALPNAERCVVEVVKY